MQHMNAAAVVAAGIVGVVGVALAGPVQIAQQAEARDWLGAERMSASPVPFSGSAFPLDDALLIRLMIDSAVVSSAPHDLGATASHSLTAFVPGAIAGPTTDSGASGGSSTGQPFTLEQSIMLSESMGLLAWDGTAWTSAVGMSARGEHAPLTLEYSTVSLPSPLIMGVLGLASLYVVRKRRLGRQSAPI